MEQAKMIRDEMLKKKKNNPKNKTERFIKDKNI